MNDNQWVKIDFLKLVPSLYSYVGCEVTTENMYKWTETPRVIAYLDYYGFHCTAGGYYSYQNDWYISVRSLARVEAKSELEEWLYND